jgi:hypothetical protein
VARPATASRGVVQLVAACHYHRACRRTPVAHVVSAESNARGCELVDRRSLNSGILPADVSSADVVLIKQARTLSPLQIALQMAAFSEQKLQKICGALCETKRRAGQLC